MKKTAIALALALTLTGALTACGGNRSASDGGGTNVSAGQVSRRQEENSARTRDYLDDGRYAAGEDGRVRAGDGNALTRDLTRDARDMMRDAGDDTRDLTHAAGQAGRDLTNGVKNAARDLQRGMEQTARQ